MVVSNDGWSIIRTQGYNPEVIAVSPTGDDVVRVRVTDRPPVPGEKPEPPEERRYWELVRAVLVAPET
ncbi:hypothetical protein ACN28I_38165 [Archangium gephyra]|uniref:hypothetical protein n=1 Tax=Archangium gephyra TaxID=48 RepID=UPI003B820B81